MKSEAKGFSTNLITVTENYISWLNDKRIQDYACTLAIPLVELFYAEQYRFCQKKTSFYERVFPFLSN